MFDRDNGETKSATPIDPVDEGGLRAPPGLTGWRKAWWWFDFIILVKLARLRFIAVLVVIGAVIVSVLLDAGAGRAAAQADTAEARAAGINSTPTLELDGQRFVGLQPVEQLAAAIEAAAAEKGATPATPSDG